MKKIFFLLALILCFTKSAHASCTGGGLTWTCAASTTLSTDINSAISSGSDGMTITVAAGNSTFNSQINLSTTKGVTIICAAGPPTGPGSAGGGNGAATTGGCNISASGQFLGLGFFNTDNSRLYRFSGFNITTSATGFDVWFCTAGGCSGTYSKIRFDHNTITHTGAGGSVTIFLGEGTSDNEFYGSIDNNVLNCAQSCSLFEANSKTTNRLSATAFGTLNNMFIENNTINITTLTATGSGCTDGWSAAFKVVYRYNIDNNCRILAHGVPHGGGPHNFEVYFNQNNLTSGAIGSGIEDGYRSVHFQGALTQIVFGNVIKPQGTINSDAIVTQDFRDCGPGPSCNEGGKPPACDGSASSFSWDSITFSDGNRAPSSTWFGYPCWHMPSRDENLNYKPIYAVKNTNGNTGAKVDLSFDGNGGAGIPPPCTQGAAGNCVYDSIHFLNNREYYNAVSVNAQTSPTSPFDGTTGGGYGTLANRPTTCATSTETAFGAGAAGVFYYATDVGAQGTFYTCDNTNHWSVYFTPEIYPNPLAGTGLLPPTNIIVNPGTQVKSRLKKPEIPQASSSGHRNFLIPMVVFLVIILIVLVVWKFRR